jgi:hypothetical protein
LAGLWLLGGVDLSMTALARQRNLLDAADEYNPLAALVLPFGFWAVLGYKLVFTSAGSAVLMV